MAKRRNNTKIIELRPNHYVAVDYLGSKKVLGMADLNRLLDLESRVLAGTLANTHLNGPKAVLERSIMARGSVTLLTIGRLLKTILERQGEAALKEATLKQLLKALDRFDGVVRKRSPDRIANDLRIIASWSKVAESDKQVLNSFASDFDKLKARLFVRKRVSRPRKSIKNNTLNTK
jgi:hypothetical protein